MGLQIDKTKREARVNGDPLSLEPKLFDLLECLSASDGDLVTKNQLLEAVWDARVVSDAAISQAVAKLRRSLRTAGLTPDPIKTVHGHGYRWLAPETKDPAPVKRAASNPASGKSRWRGVTLALLAAAGLFLGFRPQQASAPAKLAVAPLAVAADTDIDWAELGLASLLSDALDDRTPLRVMSPSRVRSALRSRGVSSADPSADQLTALSELADVDHLLLAAVARGPNGYRINYELTSASVAALSGTFSADSIEMLAAGMTQVVAADLDVAYAAGIPLKKISADEFVNEAFARGMQALLSGDSQQASSYFESAIASDPEMAWARYELANAQSLLGQWEASRGQFELAFKQAKDRGDLNLAGAAASGLGVLAWRNGDLDQAENHLQDARSQFETVGNNANLASALGNLGILAENQGRMSEAKTLYGRTLALYRGEGERLGESVVYTNLATLERKQGRFAEAEELQRRAVDIQEKAGLRQLLVFSYAQLGKVVFALGRWQEGASFLSQSQTLAEELGDRLGFAEALSVRSEQLIMQGKLGEAHAALNEALDIYSQLNNPAGEGAARLLLASIAQWQGEYHESHLQADLAYEIFNTINNPMLKAQALISRAAGKGADVARADLATALHLAQESADSALLAKVLVARSEVEGEPVELLTEALTHASAARDRGLEAQTAIELGLALLDREPVDSQQVEALVGTAQTWQPNYHGTLFLEARIAQHEGRQSQSLALMERAKTAAGQCWTHEQQTRLESVQALLVGG
ncbi:MAG: tetratricopeptide repeat protein [Lysobacterales bacterium]